MASPSATTTTTPRRRSSSTGTAIKGLSITPGARVLKSPLADETIWKRLKEAGFDEESIKRRDKAALIAYIANLETQIFDLQHHMGLLISERKELESRYEQLKASFEAAELARRHDQAAHLSALAVARKQEENLKKALGVEKECIASMERTLHEMRAESAESKVATVIKLAEARGMMEDAQKKFIDAEVKMHAAEALQEEASRHHQAAERKLQEVEAHEDELSRRISTYRTDCDAKEKEIALERVSLSDRRKALQQEHEGILDGQALLNQREENIASKSLELNRLEKELEAFKGKLDKELSTLNEKKSNLEIAVASLSQRELAVIEREADLNKKEQELLDFQEKLSSKESIEIQKVIANHKALLGTRKTEFEAELEMRLKVTEDEIEAKRRAWELREVDISQRENLLQEKEEELELQLKRLAEKERDMHEKMNFIDMKEARLSAAEQDIELKRVLLEQEKEVTNKKNLELQKSLDSLEDKIKHVDRAKENLEILKHETNELSALEMKLKEEVDIVRAQKFELLVEEERMKAEKAKFEAEWELIDEKREELQREAEWVTEQQEAVSKFLKDERECLRLEREAMIEQHRQHMDLFNHEREENMKKMDQERSEWFSKIQQEHADFLLGIEMQKRELESSVEKRREEVEIYLRDKEKAFELERKFELEKISSLKEKALKELENVALELKKLEIERKELNLNQERSEQEWVVLNKSIEELKEQTLKLEKQRELLREERENICSQIEHLKKLEDLKLYLDNLEVAAMQQSKLESGQKNLCAVGYSKNGSAFQDTDLFLRQKEALTDNGDALNSPGVRPDIVSTPNSPHFSWIKRYANMIFKSTPEKPLQKDNNNLLGSDNGGNRSSSNGYHGQKLKTSGDFITHSVLEEKHQAGKRRNTVDDFVGVVLEHGQKNKKRRQEDPNVNILGSTTAQCVNSAQVGLPEDCCASRVVAQKSNLMIVDEVIKVSEVTCEITTVENFENKEKEELKENDTSDRNFRDGGSNGLINSSPVGETEVPSGSGVSEILKEHAENAGHDLEQNQPKEDTVIVEDPGSLIYDNSEKVTGNIGTRARSKLKL